MILTCHGHYLTFEFIRLIMTILGEMMITDYAYTPTIWPSVSNQVLLLILCIYGWQHRNIPGALPLAIGCLFAMLWSTGIILEMIAMDLATKIVWYKLQASCQVPTVTATTCFFLEYVWPGRWLTRRNIALLSIIPLLGIVAVLTNDFHHLIWIGFSFAESIIPVRGPIVWTFFIYGILWTLACFFILIWLFIRSPQHRWPVSIMLCFAAANKLPLFFSEVAVS